jgi:hypothetical protein
MWSKQLLEGSISCITNAFGMGAVMKSDRTRKNTNRGVILIISMVFILMFSTLAVCLVSLCGTNAQIANNQHKVSLARSSAHSGLENFRYWVEQKDSFGEAIISMPGDTPATERFASLADAMYADGAPVNLIYDGGQVVAVNMDPTTLDSASGQVFTAVLQPTADVDILQLDITGTALGLERKIRIQYKFGTRAHSVFDYGVATKGPLSLTGNVEISDVNISITSDVYIESFNNDEALSIIGNSQIAGDVKIANPDGYADIQGGQASIGGETVPEAYDHVESGVPPTDFPVPMPHYFLPYVQRDYNEVTGTTYTNVRIPPNTNPEFTGGETIEGVLFIDVPNVVTFAGHVTIIGIIVGNGSPTDNLGTNRIDFQGTVDSFPVTDLPDTPDFHDLRNETGTFLMSPGFAVSFGGDFETLNGAIAANGIDFYGNAGGIINGSVVNYSDVPMTLSGNSDLVFNRTGITEVPAGFGPEIIMHYIPESYEEVFDI